MLYDAHVHFFCSFVVFDIAPTTKGNDSVCAIHSRLGGNEDNLDPDVDGPVGFFCPRVASGDGPLGSCRSWSIIARATSFRGSKDDSIHLFALPLGWKDAMSSNDVSDDDEDEEHCHVPYYLSSRLVLPTPYRVKEIGFYSDDGNSSLSAGTEDGSTGREGRQAMGLLVSCPTSDGKAMAEELWLVHYDKAIYHRVSFSPQAGNQPSIVLDEQVLVDEAVINIVPLRGGQDEDENEPGTLYAKSKCR